MNGAKQIAVIVSPHDAPEDRNKYRAHLAGHPEKWRGGINQAEALGELVAGYPDVFNVIIRRDA